MTLYVVVTGGLISDMAADESVTVNVIDEDMAKIGEDATEIWNLSAGEDFDELKHRFDKLVVSNVGE